jgi:hypothetical protein
MIRTLIFVRVLEVIPCKIAMISIDIFKTSRLLLSKTKISIKTIIRFTFMYFKCKYRFLIEV